MEDHIHVRWMPRWFLSHASLHGAWHLLWLYRRRSSAPTELTPDHAPPEEFCGVTRHPCRAWSYKGGTHLASFPQILTSIRSLSARALNRLSVYATNCVCLLCMLPTTATGRDQDSLLTLGNVVQKQKPQSPRTPGMPDWGHEIYFRRIRHRGFSVCAWEWPCSLLPSPPPGHFPQLGLTPAL